MTDYGSKTMKNGLKRCLFTAGNAPFPTFGMNLLGGVRNFKFSNYCFDFILIGKKQKF
jgi:hypothetical protein